jgi:hypothetical protein
MMVGRAGACRRTSGQGWLAARPLPVEMARQIHRRGPFEFWRRSDDHAHPGHRGRRRVHRAFGTPSNLAQQADGKAVQSALI